MNNKYKFETKAIHSGMWWDQFGSVVPPVSVSSTFKNNVPGVPVKKYDYRRAGSPSMTAYQEALADLELGSFALATASGCAATDLTLNLLATGDHVLSSSDIYGGTHRLFESIYKKSRGLDFSYHDFQCDSWKKLVQKNTKMIWLETPSNPIMWLVDLKKVTDEVKAINPDILVVCDNTFSSPYCQQPLELGVDLVVHSATKFLGGHSDIIGGAVVGRNKDLMEPLEFLQKSLGATPSGWDLFLLSRSLKTLSVRLQKHCENALKMAKFLESHPAVEKVFYPDLQSHPQHELAQRQMPRGAGGVLSFYMKGDYNKVEQCLLRLKIVALAESLGGVESLICHPARMTHASIPESRRLELGITDTFLRLSVGIEDFEDLKQDLSEALA